MSFGALAGPVSKTDIAQPDLIRNPSVAGMDLVFCFTTVARGERTVRKEIRAKPH